MEKGCQFPEFINFKKDSKTKQLLRDIKNQERYFENETKPSAIDFIDRWLMVLN